MEYLSVKNWEEFQHYKDREPKWIKVYRSLLIDYKFDQLSDGEFGILVKTWLLASQMDNKIPNDATWIKNKLGLVRKPKLKKYIDLEFLMIQNGTKSYNKDKESVSKRYLETETDKDKETDKDNILFSEFWNLYPKKVGKGNALKTWNRIKHPKEVLDKIKIALAWQITSNQWTKEHGQYIPNPATYLNQNRWEDENGEQKDDRGHDRVYFKHLDFAE